MYFKSYENIIITRETGKSKLDRGEEDEFDLLKMVSALYSLSLNPARS